MYPATGPLAPFGEANKFVIGAIQQTLKSGLTIGGRKYDVEIITKDSQSSANRAGETAADLILKDKIDLMVAGNTPETANPVSDQCELNEVPCVATLCPWQPWFFGRKGDPAKGFNWTYLFFWGLEDVIAVFTNLWKSVPTNKVVGGLFPNDADGNAWGDPQRGFPPVLAKDGFKLVDPGRFQNLTADFSAQIAAFKKDNAEIVTGVLIPPDIKTFLTQARQQGFRPKVVTVGKALLFPASVEALGELGDGMTTEVWWTPTVPYKSSLTGQSAKQLADAYEASTKKQWTQPIGFVHALFEVAIDTFKRTKDLGSQGVDPRRDGRHQPRHDRRQRLLGQGAGEERDQDAARGRTVGARQEVQVRADRRRQPDRAERPGRGQAQADRLTLFAARGARRRRRATPAPRRPMGEVLELAGVRKSFGALRVIDDLSLAVASGELVGVIGPNGAGKTTLLNLVSGDLRADAGSIRFRGEEIGAAPPHERCRRGIGRSYQIPQPFGGMTVFENLLVAATFGAACPRTRRAARASRCSTAPGSGGTRTRSPGGCTLLDRKRLELARALATQPQLLLLDEIAGGLTEHEARELVALIRRSRPRARRWSGSSTSCTRSSRSPTGSSRSTSARSSPTGRPTR